VPYFDGWGYVRLFDASSDDGGRHLRDPPGAQEGLRGRLRRPVGAGGRHLPGPRRPGLPVLLLRGRPATTVGEGDIKEVGAFIDDHGNNFWGVEVFSQGDQEYAALSDRDFGLYIVKLAP
jgi:hypothetical protein